MYSCEKHGPKPTDWCDECGKPILCDCSETSVQRFKDLNYGYDDRTVTVYLTYCDTCGEPISIGFVP